MKEIDLAIGLFVKSLDMFGIAAAVAVSKKKILRNEDFSVSVRSNTRDANDSIKLVSSLVAFESQCLNASTDDYISTMSSYIEDANLCIVRCGSIEEQIDGIGRRHKDG